MQHRQLKHHLTLVTALLLILIGGLTGSTLIVLRNMHGKVAHTTAAETVINTGSSIVKKLAAQPAVISTNDTTDWSAFSHLLSNLYSIEGGIQYVSVTCDNLVLFYEQTTSIDTTKKRTLEAPNGKNKIGMQRELLHIGDNTVPVVVFSTTVTNKNATPVTIRLALRKDTVAREEKPTDTAITSMFRLSLITVLVSFSICLILVVWMMRREIKRESIRREEEHLAFSGMLANGIVHDFRNPMSSMKLDVQMLHRQTKKDDIDVNRISALANRISNTVDRMDKVFQEFLYVSRPDQDKRISVNLVNNLKGSLEMLAPRFENAEIESELNFTSHDITVLAYESSLTRALVNIITNAIQFSPKKSTVTINIYTTDNSAVVEVIDQGPGIPKSKHKKVFEMFETERPEGTGLGLFIAKAAIERNQGSIHILDNKNDTGTTVRITIPSNNTSPTLAQ